MDTLQRYYVALNNPIHIRCPQISKILDETSIEDLPNQFSLLVQDVFGVNVIRPDWELRSLTRNGKYYKDYDALYSFLQPRGAVFKVIDRLMPHDYKFPFAISRLPEGTRKQFNECIPPMYQNKTDFLQTGKPPTELRLNAFDFYFFHFAYFLVNPRSSRIVHASATAFSDSLYLNLVEDYLNTFLPIGVNPASNNMSSYSSHGFAQPIERCSGWNARTGGKLTFLKQRGLAGSFANSSHLVNDGLGSLKAMARNLLSITPQPSASDTMAAGRLSNTHLYSELDLWRAHTVIEIFTDMWLHQWTGGGRCRTDSTYVEGSQFMQNHSYSNQASEPNIFSFSDMSLTQDYVRTVRLLVKHVYWFGSSANPNSNMEFDNLKRTAASRYMRLNMYRLLKHLISSWPLDGSFRYVIELWLSYIQPWRYIDEPDDQGDDTANEQLAPKWVEFVQDNLVAYTVIFCHMINRFYRMDLTTERNAYMLHRVGKVLASYDLRAVIADVEKLANDCFSRNLPGGRRGLSPHRSFSGVSFHEHRGVTIAQRAFELETTDFVYVPMFGDETLAKVYDLIWQITDSLECINRMPNGGEVRAAPRSEGSGVFSGIFTKLVAFLEVDTRSESDEYGGQRKQPEKLLDATLCYFVAIFGITDYDERRKIRQQHTAPKECQRNDPTDRGMPDCFYGLDGSVVLTPLGRYQVINKIRRFKDIPMIGNPDTQPVRSFEVGFVVRFLHKLSKSINARYVETFKRLYAREDLVGSTWRRILQPPITYHYYTKLSTAAYLTPGGAPSRVPVKLPPRLCLRYLAQKDILGYLLVFLIISFVFGHGLFVSLTLVVAMMGCAVLMNIFSDVPRKVNESNKLGNR